MPMIDGKYCITKEEAHDSYRALAPLLRNAKDGSVFVLVPGGEFEMGDDDKDGNRPKHRVQVDAFYIGVTCVTNRQYARFVKETRHRAPHKADYGTAVWAGGRCPDDKLDHPVVCVSWDDAAAYAKWDGCALPTEAQWEKAARGPKNLLYPWGDAWDASKCRNSGNKGSEQTCPIWEYPAGASGYGTLNQSGNVWEWCKDWYGDKYYSELGAARNPEGPSTGSCRVLRSGDWNSVYISNCWRGGRGRDGPALRIACLGFRLVRSLAVASGGRMT